MFLPNSLHNQILLFTQFVCIHFTCAFKCLHVQFTCSWISFHSSLMFSFSELHTMLQLNFVYPCFLLLVMVPLKPLVNFEFWFFFSKSKFTNLLVATLNMKMLCLHNLSCPITHLIVFHPHPLKHLWKGRIKFYLKLISFSEVLHNLVVAMKHRRRRRCNWRWIKFMKIIEW